MHHSSLFVIHGNLDPVGVTPFFIRDQCHSSVSWGNIQEGKLSCATGKGDIFVINSKCVCAILCL